MYVTAKVIAANLGVELDQVKKWIDQGILTIEKGTDHPDLNLYLVNPIYMERDLKTRGVKYSVAFTFKATLPEESTTPAPARKPQAIAPRVHVRSAVKKLTGKVKSAR